MERLVELSAEVKRIKSYSIERLSDLAEVAYNSFISNDADFAVAENSLEALKIIKNIIKDEKVIVASSARVPYEIGLPELVRAKGGVYLNTDLGRYIHERYFGGPYYSRVHPSISYDADEIAKKWG